MAARRWWCRAPIVRGIYANLRTLQSWTIAHHPFHLAFKSAVPYALVTVDMEDGVRMHAPWRGAVGALALGLPVRVVFEKVDEQLTLPAFVAMI